MQQLKPHTIKTGLRKPSHGQQADVSKIIELYTSGLAMCEVARMIGHRHSLVRYHLRRNSIPIRPRMIVKRRAVTKELVEQIIEPRLAAGESLSAIIRELNLAPASVHRWRQKLGCPRLPHGTGRPYHGKGYKMTEGRYEHIAKAESVLGRSLKSPECVHHHNGMRRGGELIICPDNAYHRLLHVRMKAYAATGDPKKRRCYYCKQWDSPQNLIKYVRSLAHRGGCAKHGGVGTNATQTQA